MNIDFDQPFINYRYNKDFNLTLEQTIKGDLSKLLKKYHLNNTIIDYHPMTGGYLGNIQIKIISNIILTIDMCFDYNTSDDAICIKITSDNHQSDISANCSILDKIKKIDFKPDYHFPLNNLYLINIENILNRLTFYHIIN